VKPDDHHIQRYSALREWFDTLVGFVEAARQELAQDSPVLARYGYDNWMGQLRAYQQVCCQRCGAFLSADALGLGAYAVVPFARVCGGCYDELTRGRSDNRRRLARLTAYAQEHPQLFVGLLVAAQQRLQLDDWELECALELDAVGVLRLALAQRPRPDYGAEDIAIIAHGAACDPTALDRLLTAELKEVLRKGRGQNLTQSRTDADTAVDAPF
jgi:hypothetical protein